MREKSLLELFLLFSKLLKLLFSLGLFFLLFISLRSSEKNSGVIDLLSLKFNELVDMVFCHICVGRGGLASVYTVLIGFVSADFLKVSQKKPDWKMQEAWGCVEFFGGVFRDFWGCFWSSLWSSLWSSFWSSFMTLFFLKLFSSGDCAVFFLVLFPPFFLVSLSFFRFYIYSLLLLINPYSPQHKVRS